MRITLLVCRAFQYNQAISFADSWIISGDACANYDIRSSRLQTAGREFALERISFSVGQIVTGGCQFSIGRKDAPVNISKQDYGYVAKLQWTEQRWVAFWDEEDKCGWLVKGTSALLHLLRASLEHCRKDKFSSEFLFDNTAFQEPSVRFRNDSAIEALINKRNRELRLYKLEGKSFDETVEWPDGRKETVTKTRTSYTTVEDRVMELFENLEKLIDHEAHGEASAKGVSMKPRLRSQLQGWDFRDVATNRDPLYLRVTTPPSSGRGWVDFAKSIRAVTLFGRGFGQLIRPVAEESWGAQPTLRQAMPTGMGYLGACTADIVANEGDRTTKPLTLAAGITWHNPSRHSPFAIDVGVDLDGWHPVQELLPANFNLRGLLSQTSGSETMDMDSCPPHGAVIFGRPKSSLFTWPDMGEATAVEPSAAKLFGIADDSQTQASRVSSDRCTSSALAGNDQTDASDGQDTAMTSPTEYLSRSRSGQSSNPLGSDAALGLSSSSQSSIGEDSNCGAGAAPSESGPRHGSGYGAARKKRAASEMAGGETEQRGISKKLKAISLSAGFRHIHRRAPSQE